MFYFQFYFSYLNLVFKLCSHVVLVALQCRILCILCIHNHLCKLLQDHEDWHQPFCQFWFVFCAHFCCKFLKNTETKAYEWRWKRDILAQFCKPTFSTYRACNAHHLLQAHWVVISNSRNGQLLLPKKVNFLAVEESHLLEV